MYSKTLTYHYKHYNIHENTQIEEYINKEKEKIEQKIKKIYNFHEYTVMIKNISIKTKNNIDKWQ